MNSQNLNGADVSNGTAILEKKLEPKLNINGHVGALIIDMQPDFLRSIEDSERAKLISSHLKMAKFLVANNIPTVVLEYWDEGSTEREIRDEIDKLPKHKYITKYDDDGFTQRSLHETLRDWKIKDLIIMGINASFCVKDTAQSAIRKGYSIYTARQLLANQSYEQSFFNDDVPLWFESNGVYSSDFRDLCQIIESTSDNPNPSNEDYPFNAFFSSFKK